MAPTAHGAGKSDHSPDHEAGKRCAEDDEGQRRLELPEEKRDSDRVRVLESHDRNSHGYDSQDYQEGHGLLFCAA
jgi:hypothetical protein